ncbi:MAG: 2-oxoglutarate dehydrogenase, E2 component, dihydrolipoamide succinyltransferase [Kineosporiaceae bacterium]
MAHQVQMPQLGESVTEGTITRWLKQVGDLVEVDEPLVEVSTDKVDTEIPSPVSGTVQQILVGEDETVAVGGDLAVIGDGPGTASEESAAASAPPAQQPPAQHLPAAAPAAAPAPPAPAEAVPVTGGSPGSGGPVTDITLPALGESVTEGTITRWLVQVGEGIAVDQPLLEVSTDKVDTEIPSPVAGVVTEILAAEDQTVAVGSVLARVGGPGVGDAPPAATRQTPPPTPRPAPEPASVAPSGPPPQATPPPVAVTPPPPRPADVPHLRSAAAESPAPAGEPGAGGYVTPIVRKLAGELGVALASVEGTGVGGRIRRQDVVAAAERARSVAATAEEPAATAAPSPLRGRTEPMSRIRRTISRRMMESLHSSAQLTTVVEVDVTRIARLRQRAKAGFEAREGVKLSFLPFFARAAVEALKAHPVVNASTDGESITYHDAENLGIAVDTDRGLMVPVIRNAGDLSLPGLAKRIADLAARTRDRQVGPDELSGSTFTLTNTGSRGALLDTPIINQPESAILGTGAVVKRPVVVEADGADGIAVRSMVYLALSYDHRIVDGADAARFLTTVKARLEEAAFESDLGL